MIAMIFDRNPLVITPNPRLKAFLPGIWGTEILRSGPWLSHFHKLLTELNISSEVEAAPRGGAGLGGVGLFPCDLAGAILQARTDLECWIRIEMICVVYRARATIWFSKRMVVMPLEFTRWIGFRWDEINPQGRLDKIYRRW